MDIPPILDRYGIRYNDDQLRAIASQAPAVLLVAGAGTGKTTSIEGRAAWLIDGLGVPPEDILLMSFTRKAASELVERARRISPALEIRTFHAFGLSVLTEANGRRPTIGFTEDGAFEKFVRECIERLLLSDRAFAAAVSRFCALHLAPSRDSLWNQRVDAWLRRNETHRLPHPRDVRTLARFAATFLSLYKSGHAPLAELVRTVRRRRQPREIAFLDVFAPLYRAYQEHLCSTGAIDFNDMLTLAAEAIESGSYRKKFSHVIIDEFQDISAGKHRLVAALRAANPAAKLYCVGDDWQAIYRFAGSDLSLMTGFEKYFGTAEHLKLEISNRFSNEIARATNAFIQRNPEQLRKTVRSGRTIAGPPLQVMYVGTRNRNEEILAALDGDAARRSSELGRAIRFRVFLLGRYNLEQCTQVDAAALERWRPRFPHLDIDYLTMHSSKGLTADFAILQDIVTGTLGVPCAIVDDPLLRLVLTDGETFPYAEERRVLYVALTRARYKVWLLTERGRESLFLREMVAPSEVVELPGELPLAGA